MTVLKAALSAAALCTLMTTGALVATVAPASAYVTCNREGDCWHSDARPRVPGVRLDIHPDDWYFHQKWEGDRDHHYRDYHEGRGYYKGGVWVTL